MKKMNPALIKILQKRGQNKTTKNSSIVSAVIGSFVEDFDDKSEKESTSGNGQKMITNQNYTQNGLENKDVPKIKFSSGNLWDTWSTNVEFARDLRFSLDGDVINDYDQVPGQRALAMHLLASVLYKAQDNIRKNPVRVNCESL